MHLKLSRNEMKKMFKERNSDEEFIETLWSIVSQLTTYNEEITETPRYPLETLLLGGGDCEDTAILFASLLDAANTGWKIGFFYTDLSRPHDPFNFNHVLVQVDTADKTFFVETTNKQVMNPYDLVKGELLILD